LLFIITFTLFLVFNLLNIYNSIVRTQRIIANSSELYKKCDGNSFEGFCEDEKCIKDGIERRVFELWKKRFMTLHNLTENYFDEHILISDVTYEETRWEEEVYHWWDIRYIYKNDWVRSRQSESIDLSYPTEFTGIENLQDNTIVSLLDLAIEKPENFSGAVISYPELQKLINKYKLNLDFCHIDFVNVTGELLIEGRGTKYSIIAGNSNKCEYQTVNLNTGKVEKSIAPCFYD